MCRRGGGRGAQGGGLGPQRGPDSRLRWGLPIGQAPLCGIAAEDIGACVATLFQRGPGCAGQRIGLAAGN